MVFALDPDHQGSVIWKADLSESKNKRATNLVWAAQRISRISMGLVTGSLSAVQIATGEKLWSTRLVPQGSHESYAAANTAIPGAVFIGGTDGKVHALATADGKELWSFDTAKNSKPSIRLRRRADRLVPRG